MILVDVGNTGLDFALVKKGKITKIKHLPAAQAKRGAIKKFLTPYSKQKILVCSVVPSITKIFKTLGYKTYIVGKDIKIPLKCLYNKKSVGMDRLVGAIAAKNIYPRARLIVDFGTAITFDFLSKQGDYLGGFILPGIGSTLGVLSSCALLPKKIKIKPTKKLIPQDTATSISKGMIEGFSSMVNGLIKKYKKILKLSPKETPIITGGDAATIAPYLNFSYIHDPKLVLKGLLFLAKKLP